jgi:hypothetical protein
MFCAPGHVFGGAECVGSRFHVLPAHTCFHGLSRVSGPVFLFCVSGLIFCDTVVVGSRFLILRVRTHFRRYRGRWVPLSYFALPRSFPAVSRASGPVFIFCAPGLVFGGTEVVWSRFHDLHPRSRFRQYRGRWVPFSCFVLHDSFSTVPSASDPIFMFCTPRLVFDGTEGDQSRLKVFCSRTYYRRSRFHVLCSRTCFRRYRGRRVLFSCFALPVTISAVPRASDPIFMFCTPGLVFGVIEGVGSRFHVLLFRTHFS